MESDLSHALNHEERLRSMEIQISTHQASCDERYKNIQELHKTIITNQSTMLYLIIATMLGVFGKDVVLQAIEKLFTR